SVGKDRAGEHSNVQVRANIGLYPQAKQSCLMQRLAAFLSPDAAWSPAYITTCDAENLCMQRQLAILLFLLASDSFIRSAMARDCK
ncbi:MAG: hypothetical protein ACO3WN_08105, partial [Burkholderiaceae bacterium]